MADLPRAARFYLVAVLATAAIAALIGIIVAPARLELAPVALVLLGCATIAQQFKVRSPKHQSYYTTTIFFFAAALLLHPGYVVAIILAAHAVELLRVRYRWYIQAFNVANFVLFSMAAGALFSAGLQGHPASGARAALFALLAGLVFVGLNHLLTALVIMWARGVPISRAGTMDWDNLGTDLALMSVGALGSLLWLTNPWLVPLCLGPLFLIYRSLLVPTLKEEARTDPKTELANMKHWNEVAQAEVERARRFHRPLTVVLADLDLLRDINNRHGHLNGDQMIRRVADAIREALREYDVPARFGGDEFAILMPETTLPEAMTVANKIAACCRAVFACERSRYRRTPTCRAFPAHRRSLGDLPELRRDGPGDRSGEPGGPHRRVDRHRGRDLLPPEHLFEREPGAVPGRLRRRGLGIRPD